MPLIQINDDAFSQAANAIADIVKINNPDVNINLIEKTLRSYVYLGSMRKIQDWAYSLDDDTKGAIVNAVIGRLRNYYYVSGDFTETYNDLDTMETLTSTGDVSSRIAKPRAAQDAYDQQGTQGYQAVDLQTAFQDVIQKISAFLGTTLKNTVGPALKNFGIDPTVLIVIGVAVVLLVVLNKSNSI